LIYGIYFVVEGNPDKPTIHIELWMSIRMFELIVTIAAYYKYISWIMPLEWIEMMDFKIWLAISFEKPEIARLTMAFIDGSQQSSNTCWNFFPCSV